MVAKLGGTSVVPDRIEYAASRLAELRDRGHGVVCVVSAMREKEGGGYYSTDTLEGLASQIDPSVNLRDRDLLWHCGEVISAVVMAHYIRAKYHWPTRPLAGDQAGIITDFRPGDANIRAIYPQYILELLDEDYVVVVAGFQGVTETKDSLAGYHGAICTLGRGGSDATACALGHALDAERVDIFTDVPGVMTADPDLFRGVENLAKPFAHAAVSYADVCEMAHLGARVVQARAAEIAMAHEVPLRVASTWENVPGTYVCASSEAPSRSLPPVTSVAHSEQVFPVRYEVERELDKTDVELAILHLLGQAGLSIYFVNTTRTGTSFVIFRTALKDLEELLYGQVIPVGREGRVEELTYYVIGPHRFRPPFPIRRQAGRPGAEKPAEVFTTDPWSKQTRAQLQESLLRTFISKERVKAVELTIGEPCRIVSVIGPELKERPGAWAGVLGVLEEQGVEILELAESQNSLSCLVPDHDLARTVRSLHQRIFVEKLPPFSSFRSVV